MIRKSKWLITGPLILYSCIACADRSISSVEPGDFLIKAGDIQMRVSSEGAQIVSFKIKNHEVLTQSSEHQNYGSTLWTAPQSEWGWPPYDVLENQEYLVERDEDYLKMTSRPDLKSGFQFEKTWRPVEDRFIRIEYLIRNISDSAKSAGPWEVTRVPCGGLAFFPEGAGSKVPPSSLTPDLREGGIGWIDIDMTPSPEHQKMFSSARDGWLAYARDPLLFVKHFPDIDPESYSPEQGEVEIYVNKEKSYTELENHGAYQRLEPGEYLRYVVDWHLILLPETMVLTTGNRELLNLIAKKIGP